MIRYPLLDAYSKNITATATAAYDFNLPVGDFDGVWVTYNLTTLTATSPTLDFYVQTTDGTNYFDLAHFNQTAVVTNNNAVISAWLPVSAGTAKYIGSAAASTIAVNSISGMPILKNAMRIYAVIGGSSYTTFNAKFDFYANNQSGGQY